MTSCQLGTQLFTQWAAPLPALPLWSTSPGSHPAHQVGAVGQCYSMCQSPSPANSASGHHGNTAVNWHVLGNCFAGSESLPLVALVGKGVCFDTGGLDIKSAAGMKLMKKVSRP
jgi:leucyl aminopeptidase